LSTMSERSCVRWRSRWERSRLSPCSRSDNDSGSAGPLSGGDLSGYSTWGVEDALVGVGPGGWDDEGEGDEDAAAGMGGWDDSDKETTTSKTRSRSGSISASRLKGKYRTQGVQTIQRIKRSVGVQAPDSENGKKSSPRGTKSVGTSTQAPLVVVQAASSNTNQVPQTLRPTSSFPAAHPASGLRSPREVTSPPDSSPSPPLTHSVPTSKATSPLLPLTERTLSNETNASIPSSTSPISPTDGQPIGSLLRKGGRVWDPARGVELFKRGSEEVLARFLKMGSWEEDATTQRHHV